MKTSIWSWKAQHIYHWCSCSLLSATISGSDLSWLGMLSSAPSHSLLAVQCTICCVIVDLDHSYVQCTTPLRITVPIPITEKYVLMQKNVYFTVFQSYWCCVANNHNSGKILPQLIIQTFTSLLFSTWKYKLWSAVGNIHCGLHLGIYTVVCTWNCGLHYFCTWNSATKTL